MDFLTESVPSQVIYSYLVVLGRDIVVSPTDVCKVRVHVRRTRFQDLQGSLAVHRGSKSTSTQSRE